MTPEMLSIAESTPNPIKAVEPAARPAQMDTAPSMTFHPMVTYSSCLPSRSTAVCVGDCGVTLAGAGTSNLNPFCPREVNRASKARADDQRGELIESILKVCSSELLNMTIMFTA